MGELSTVFVSRINITPYLKGKEKELNGYLFFVILKHISLPPILFQTVTTKVLTAKSVIRTLLPCHYGGSPQITVY